MLSIRVVGLVCWQTLTFDYIGKLSTSKIGGCEFQSLIKVRVHVKRKNLVDKIAQLSRCKQEEKVSERGGERCFMGTSEKIRSMNLLPCKCMCMYVLLKVEARGVSSTENMMRCEEILQILL